MAALKDVLDYQRRQATLAELIQNEAAMVEKFTLPAAAPLSDADLQLIADFTTWCSQRRVRALPARPEIVATFLKELAHRGPEYVLAMTEAIGRNHMKHTSLSDPAVSRAVHFVIDQIIKTDPPRSWSKEDKLLFMSLPAQIRAVIARREQERESGLRRKQNELAEEIKKLKQPPTKETDDMTKRRKEHEVLGKYAGTDTGIRRQADPQGSMSHQKRGTDISDAVDAAAKVNGGLSGKLPSPGTPEQIAMAVDPTKAKSVLAARLHMARDSADQYIDRRAQELAKQNPGVPVGVLRQTICRGGNCPCSYALALLDEDK